jgi:enediyne biosynthesis protein E4
MRIVLFFLIVLLIACSNEQEHQDGGADRLFKRLSADKTGIDFQNILSFREDFDVFRYRNYYNGAGVAIGDINNDGLSDIYLTSNMGDNKLFLNKGQLQFEDITDKAGVKGSKVWSTGVSMADVNGDGFLDIYVCNSGDVKGSNQENELFINNGDLTFSEKAVSYGLADKGFSTHAVFFDYDKDGDLDCYVLNNSFQPPSSLGYRNLRNERDELGGDKLYNNDNGHFTDASEKAGIFGSLIGFGLGVTAGDVNLDGWPDIYVSNDFYERDYLYINNQDGTFSETLEKSLGHISMFSMGADIADLDNDGYPEIFSTDMLPEDDYRLKTLVAFETYDVHQLRVRSGYYHQYMRNMLHRNNQDGTFSEIGRMAGVSATDWSWGALIADFDNDGYKEIFVSNGIYKDVTNQDFVEFLGSEQIHAAMEGKKIDYEEFLKNMPSMKINNYMFTRKGDWQYTNVAKEWGLDEPSFSNGAAYGDLDNDGDLDLVINNVNQELFFYQNQSQEQKKNNYLAISFAGKGQNTFGVGAKVVAKAGALAISQEHYPIRGYQSSMDYKMILGLSDAAAIDSLIITWSDGKAEVIKDVKTNQQLVVKYENAVSRPSSKTQQTKPASLLIPLPVESITHRENNYDDFDRDRLMYHMLSTQGPAFAKADLNADGLDDFFLGGSRDHPGAIYMQKPGGNFLPAQQNVFISDSLADDVDALFFDADGDGDQDLYVVSGGSEQVPPNRAFLDRLYENTGLKNGLAAFKKTEGQLPAVAESGSCVATTDIDIDGDLDLFVGTRSIPGAYGMPADQYIFVNDGKGHFTDGTSGWAAQFSKLGMVTDAVWFDYDKNGYDDLLTVGEWMPVMLFRNDGKKLVREENIKGLENSSGWWNRITGGDVDGDGDTDFVLGNLGLNSRFVLPEGEVTKLFVNDFDQNGSADPIFAFTHQGKDYPVTLRHDLLGQMTSLKKKFVYYKDYAGKPMNEIVAEDLLKDAIALTLKEPRTVLLRNEGMTGFVREPLPQKVQVAPVFGVCIEDIDHDAKQDIVLGGNLFAVKPEAGRYDALHGLILTTDATGRFGVHPEGNLQIEGEVRHIAVLKSDGYSTLIFVRNNNAPVFFKIRR